MIEPGTYNKFVIYAGANWDKTLQVTIDGTPVNWTGYSARMMVKQYENSTAVISLYSGAGITLGGTAGTITIAMSSTQTNVTPGRYLFDLELVSGGNVTRILQGKLTVNGQVTT
jgi:hypothetical protein